MDCIENYNTFKDFPTSRLYFVTIKDNTHLTRWDKMGKINDWCRRYSKAYLIVKGTHGGTHHHLLIGVTIGFTEFKFPKGIHFHVSCLLHKPDILPDYNDLVLSKRKKEHFTKENFNNLVLFEHDETINIITKINLMIKKYWRLKKGKEDRKIRMTNHEKQVLRCLLYLQKNLDEPREEEELEKYIDYLLV